MILSAIKYFRGFVYVHLTGYAPERFLNLCGNRDILIWNLTPCEDGYFFYISVYGFKQLKPILKKTKTKIHILKRYGVPFTIFRYRRRKIYAMGILIFAGLLYYCSGFIWNIEVGGNSYLSEEMILDFLKEKDCSFGTKKKDIDCEALEEALRSSYSEVIWTSIKIYGTKMTVDIQENLLPEENYIKKEDTVYDIVAKKDGVISSIVTRSGTPLIVAGSEVKQGDLLVCGRMEILDDNGEVSGYLYHSCEADIIAKVTYEYRDEIPVEYIDPVKTGNTKTDYKILFGQRALSNPFFKTGYENFNVVSETDQLHFTDNFYLPVYLTRETYEEYKKEKKRRTKEEAQEIASKNLANYIKNLEENGIQITAKNVIIEKKNEIYVVSGTIEALESVVSYQPTEIKHTTSQEGQNTDESD